VALPDMDINKGVELLLRGETLKPKEKKALDLKFSFLNRDIHLTLDIKKKQ
jgi:hypothetical protein|tara:strand:- start:395 stop:547 length:153 start_codon:yes stop_codon:yes gene_type:complete